jgi:hypothetical protein
MSGCVLQGDVEIGIQMFRSIHAAPKKIPRPSMVLDEPFMMVLE